MDEEVVAERISYFCLARNLIWPLGSTHNFTLSGWLILFIPDHLSGQQKLGKLPNTLPFRWTTSFRTDVLLSALQLYNNYISFLYFFPSYETCSININPLFHAVIKNLHIKPYGIFFLLLHHPPLFSNNT